jgi:hypothetical protein
MKTFLMLTGPETDLWLAFTEIITVSKRVISAIYSGDALEKLILIVWWIISIS